MAVTTASIEGHLIDIGRAQELVSGALQAGGGGVSGVIMGSGGSGANVAPLKVTGKPPLR
jgi:hypothetical protein